MNASNEVRNDAAPALLDDVTRQLKFAESLPDPRAISSEELTRRRCAVQTARARLEETTARAAAAAAQIKLIATQIERSDVRFASSPARLAGAKRACKSSGFSQSSPACGIRLEKLRADS